MPGAEYCPLPDGRWLGRHGPIEVLVAAEGEAEALAQAHAAAWQRLQGLLAELVAELPALRQPLDPQAPWAVSARAWGPGPERARVLSPSPQGPVARAMWQACAPLARVWLTPMCAVAGAVADALVACYRRPGIRRAWVNNGGDIALHLAPGESLRVGQVADVARWAQAAGRAPGATAVPDGHILVHADMPVRGIATSGWRGRSLSLGIADAVTVLAASAAQADAAATVLANAVTVAHPGIRRAPAHTLRDDSDLGAIPATVDVPALPPALQRQALAHGGRVARRLRRDGLLVAAALVCQRQALRCGPLRTAAAAAVPLPHPARPGLPAVADPAPAAAARADPPTDPVGSVFAT